MEHIIPFDSTPRSFPFLILIPPSVLLPSCPPATFPPSSTTGTLQPSVTFGAPVTICIVSVPISTWQMTSLSASGCFSMLFTCPITILSRSSSMFSYPSTLEPDNVMASIYSCGVQLRPGTKSLIHFNEVFIMLYSPIFFLELI